MSDILPTDRLAVRPTEAARLLSVTRQHIYNLMNAGLLPSYQVGRVRLIPVSALREMIGG